MRHVAIVASVLTLQAGLVVAGTFPGSISREPLVRGSISDRLSVGVSYERVRRGIDVDGVPLTGDFEADHLRGYLGYDMLPWMTVFVSAGATELKGGTWSDTDYDLSVSAGLHGYLWEGDVLTPAFAAGRMSIKATMEIGRYSADSNAGGSDWIEFVAALPFGYEIFERYPVGKSGLSTSLALYAGPAFSYLDGDVAVLPGVTSSFSSDQELGALAGADVYFSPVVSIGGYALIMDEVSYGATARFHF